jgi:dihydroxyacid dehydratase/phosphogluconate dehydratase
LHALDGDVIRLDTKGRRLDLLLEPGELEWRNSAWTPPPRRYARGYTSLFLDRVRQVDEGCDFDFLEYGPATPEPEIH